MTLIPAYGRDYTSKKAVMVDWDAGRDFYVSDFFSPYDGKPTNKHDIERMPNQQILIRYKKMAQIAEVVKLTL